MTGLAATRAAQEAFGPAADAHRLVRLANEGDEQARDDPRRHRPLSRLRHGLVREHLRAGADRHRRRLRRRRLGVSDPGRRTRSCAARRCARCATRCSVVRAELGTSAGLDRRRLRRVRGARRGGVDAARRLRDADREPRGRDAARARGAARGRRRALRGHAAHARRCSRATASTRALLSYHEHNEAARTAELLPRLEAGERIALVSDAGHAGRLRSRRAHRAGGARRGHSRDGAAGRVRGRDGARRVRARRRAVPVRRLPAARREGLGRCGASSRGVAVAGRCVRVAAAAARDAAVAGGRRSRARGRGLPRADEALRGGRARDGVGARRRASPSRRRARSRSSSARAWGRRQPTKAWPSRPWPSWSRRACRAGARPSSIARAHRHRAQPPLPRLSVISFDNVRRRC